MTGNVKRIIAGDPGRHHDPFGISGVDVNIKLKKIKVKLAIQLIDTPYSAVAVMFKQFQKQFLPDFMGLESNNKGKKILSRFRTEYKLFMSPINTSNNLKLETINQGHSMDKNFTIFWLVHRFKGGDIIFPSREVCTEGMLALIEQINSITLQHTPSGQPTYRAMRSRHDDIFMAFLFCCHIARLYILKGNPDAYKKEEKEWFSRQK